MILPDVNLLVYAARSDSPRHEEYNAWLGDALGGSTPVALTATTAGGFVRIVTNRRIFPADALDTSQALYFLDRVLAARRALWVEPGPRWWSIFSRLCRDADARGNLVPDAALAAIAIEHGCELHTADRGFGRYPSLRWRHPLDP